MLYPSQKRGLMSVEFLSIPGCWAFRPIIHSDSRGKFFEWFQDSTFSELTNQEFSLAQANCSVSKKGVLRGIHFTSYEPGQSKIVSVFSGKVLDVLIDLRKNSPTFKKWEAVLIDSEDPTAVYIPWGVGHGFMSLEEGSTFVYLCDQRYSPQNEFDLNALDPEIGIQWPSDIDIIQSEKDKNAPFIKNIMDKLPN